MTSANTGTSDIASFRFADDGVIPNNPDLPFLVYRRAFDLARDRTPADTITRRFKANGWGDSWTYGIFFYAHFHPQIHEVLGVARGTARIRFGGAKGETLALTPGDVAILPAGTGHQCIESSADFCVVGAYPPDGRYSLLRASIAEHDAALPLIPHTPLPRTDPVHGRGGPLPELWRQ